MDASSSYHNLSLPQAVVTTLSADAILVWLSAAIKPTTPPPPLLLLRAPVRGVFPCYRAAVDLNMVLGAMGASVGFDEAAALFDEEEARAAFAVFDRDGDGFIDAGELGSVLRSLGLGSGAEECRRMINAYDEDRDGRIDFREFVKLMEQ